MRRQNELVPTKVPVKEGWEGYVLANNIYKLVKGKNLLLLRGGWKLSSGNIYALQKHGISHMNVLIEKPPDKDKSPDETEETLVQEYVPRENGS